MHLPARLHIRTISTMTPRVRLVLGLALVASLEVFAHLVIRLTGGLPNAFAHLTYAGIVLAGYLFGWRMAMLAGIVGGLLIGPIMDLSGVHTDGPQAWLTRGISYSGIGLLTGLLFDRSRASTLAWRDTALRVATRERDGMVALARGAEAKDTDTGDHVKRVQAVSERLALASGLSVEEAAAIGWAGMLHDVGKLHVPDRILLKPGPLTADEWDIMRQHPVWGEQILAEGDGFALARRIARWHHENFDGTGYPDQIAGIHIPFEARIVRVADAFDAMTHTRPYQRARPVEDALEELDRWAGRQFDPDLVRLFVAIVRCDSAASFDLRSTPVPRFERAAASPPSGGLSGTPIVL